MITINEGPMLYSVLYSRYIRTSQYTKSIFVFFFVIVVPRTISLAFQLDHLQVYHASFYPCLCMYICVVMVMEESSVNWWILLGFCLLHFLVHTTRPQQRWRER